MEKFLFADGAGEVREVQSSEELQARVAATAGKDAIRIWLYNTNEWISYDAFIKQFPKYKQVTLPEEKDSGPFIPTTAIIVQPKNRYKGILRGLFYIFLAAGVLLVFNFTNTKWSKTEGVSVKAERPANVPLMDIDSLIADIEITRGHKIDKGTKANLRLRNTWPDKILLQATAERDVSNSGNKYYNINITIDNTTGFKLDRAVAKIAVWKNQEIFSTDTVQFNTIPYGQKAERELTGDYRGDSITVSFESIGAKAFNFCYSASKENNSGNYNDRWFCRE